MVHGTGDKSTNRPASNWHTAEDLHKSLIFKLQRRQLKQHSECLVQTTMFTDFSSLKIIIEKIVITLAKLINSINLGNDGRGKKILQ